MVETLASFFRGVAVSVGITAPPADAPFADQQRFVYMWLGVVVVVLLWCGFLLYLLAG
jgi:hypothetical protein